ncbi:MAG: phosphoribosylformylglycinamidine cyclo-ligase [Coriobacteriia bacterium]|jgi:phosphoribosylformylglycinamidine cyclo-ligase|nr:phosphoribosylformylglycinamidine cyclo-ligase [Coriobacteriia bacterium]
MTERDDTRSITYRDAGVNTAEGARAVNAIRSAVRSTYRPEVLGDIGGFGGLFSASALKEMDDPVLVSGTDGVGTKLRLAQLLGQHDTVGIDLVAMCANDILTCGAEPLFFLDYIAIGALRTELIEHIIEGVAEGCRQAGCALVGGEMAEHPGTMAPDDYDLSGFCVGVIDRAQMVDGSAVRPGDVILGLESSGLHSNGYSLVRKALVEGREEELSLARLDLGGATLGDVLLRPTRIYVRPVLEAIRTAKVNAMAHITGGGITENLDRVLPEDCDAEVVRGAWRVPHIFDVVAEAASLDADEMYRTFNMGIGFALVCSPTHAPALADRLRGAGERVTEIGEITEGTGVVRYR